MRQTTQGDPRIPRAAYTVDELPEITTFGRTVIKKAIADGRLKARRYGKRIIVLPNDLEAFLSGLEAVR